MTTKNETVFRQNLSAGNIAKSMTSDVTVHCYSRMLKEDRLYCEV